MHPSLGDPGDVVDYVPLTPFQASMPCPSMRHPFRVRVPHADIPNIFAHRQWRAGMLLADLIFAQALPLQERNVLELGAGTGLPSIAAHKFGKVKLVVATDYDSPSLVQTLRRNVADSIESPSAIKVAGHTWAKAIDDVQDLVPGGSFDAILLADCIWDDLSHAALIKSVTSLLRKDGQSRVYMVSGLHTGRSKIVSFLRRAHRQGLHLVPFPSLPGQDWPTLDAAERAIQIQEAAAYANEAALAHAPRHVLEVPILSDAVEDEAAHHSNGITRIWQAKTARLATARRAFVIEEREEEKVENGGVHVRNRWMTFLALAWQ